MSSTLYFSIILFLYFQLIELPIRLLQFLALVIERKKIFRKFVRLLCTFACSEGPHTMTTSSEVWWKRNSSMIWQHWQSTVPKGYFIYQVLSFPRSFRYLSISTWLRSLLCLWASRYMTSYGRPILAFSLYLVVWSTINSKGRTPRGYEKIFWF